MNRRRAIQGCCMCQQVAGVILAAFVLTLAVIAVRAVLTAIPVIPIIPLPVIAVTVSARSVSTTRMPDLHC